MIPTHFTQEMMRSILMAHPDIDFFNEFHGYKVHASGMITGKNGRPMKFELRPRRGGGADPTVRLLVNKKSQKFTVARLVCESFFGPLHGLEVNHLNRNTLDIRAVNLEPSTRSANQKHWRVTPKSIS